MFTGALLATALLQGCGGGGGGSSDAGGNVNDVPFLLVGTPGKLSQTPTEANSGAGAAPPPSFAASVTTDNHWFRIEFPFDIDPTTILDSSANLEAFSYLNGNITIVDPTGAHVPGLALINGRDAFGVDRSTAVGFPHDLTTSGRDQNLGKRVFLFIADADGSLATPAPFGGYQPDPGNPNTILETTTSTIDTVRVNVFSVNGITTDAAWTFSIGNSDTRPPFVVSIGSEERNPLDPFNVNSTSATGALIVQFSEPLVPRSVGKSAVLNGAPFDGNMPNPLLSANLPPSAIIATVNLNVGTLFVPFDCEPLNVNNLTTYRFTPLIALPSNSSVDVLIRSLTTNNVAATDLAGNVYDGQDTTGDGVGEGVDHTVTFSVGPGPAVVNIPVSPEVVYFAPSSGDGLGAIDLNGHGLGTNTPGANSFANRPDAFAVAPIVTVSWTDTIGCERNPGGLNTTSGIGLIAYPGNAPTPVDPCTLAPMREFAHNRFYYPVGLGSFPYGPVQNASRGATEFPDEWFAPNDLGNPGTPVPGINEGSSGFETLCRDSNGDAILTGRDFGVVGNVQDMVVGDFLDRIYFDKFNQRANVALHLSFFGGAGTLGRNVISDPPIPNPPPTRYWVGLPQVDVNFDPNAPGTPGVLIEGDEVWTGFRPNGPNAISGVVGAGAFAPVFNGYVQLRSNPVNPSTTPDKLLPPFAVGPQKGCWGNGPGHQSATSSFSFASRQQIGNFLYVTDASTREVHAVNSNTMRVISSISLPDPTGLAISPDMEFLYVTNFSNDSLSVISSDPSSPNFHREIARVATGIGPRAVAVQGEHEDIFVCNYLGDTVSVIDPASLTVRKTLDALISGPWDVEVSPRQEQPSAPHPSGWACGLYFAYISNAIGNTVVVYESGPDGPRGIGIDNIRGSLPNDDDAEQMIAPRGLCFSPFANPLGLFAGGVFVAHRDDLGNGRVSHIQFTQQAVFGPLVIQVPPGFFLPPGFTDRVFEITGTWGATTNSVLAGDLPSDVALADMNTQSYRTDPSASPNFGGVGDAPQPERSGGINSKNFLRLQSFAAAMALAPDRLYVSFDDTDEIQVLSPTQAGLVLKTIEGHGGSGTKKLGTFWRQ
ncbi:MAG: YncE family protein [Planctomycetes bacterium]|nr:YncE family protein [Planctomycetota bacterium]